MPEYPLPQEGRSDSERARSAGVEDAGGCQRRQRTAIPLDPPSSGRGKTSNVTGILLLDKPSGISSNRALQQAKRLFGAAKAGHTGSLDPLATGLLPVCFGEATKIAGYLLGARKAYAAECQLGVTTDTCDSDGAVLAERPVPALDDAAIRDALKRFTGRITQIPPVYSALKQGGVPLYKRARRGEAVEAPPREVEVFRFGLLQREGNTLRLHVECGSGTYVRSLVRDLGEALGCGAHMTALRRLWVEPFREPRMFTLDELAALREQGADALARTLLPIEAGLVDWPVLHLDELEANAVARGRVVRVDAKPGRCRAEAPSGRLLAIGEVDATGAFSVLRGFVTSNPL
ncbi:MAG: tRNA pseudouridine(55) synthase [Rhodanobacteraceae bacterium]|jgi:tRNA pseudouridine55 synthase|nr:MAG: tRNA pseudouridine(55) synthase [Rhodanobacteraceae bacterium]